MPQPPGQIALVTGGSSGIGAACAAAGGGGATVVVTGVQDVKGDAVAAELGAPSLYTYHDVTSEDVWIAAGALAAERAIAARVEGGLEVRSLQSYGRRST